MSEKKLTERQRRFIDAYIKTGNASEAARCAGYAIKSADVTGAQLLVNTKIKAEISRRLSEIKNNRTAELQEVLEFMTSVMRGQEKDFAIVGKKQIEVPVCTRDRLKAAEYLAKIHGAFKQEVQITNAIPIVISGGDELED